MTRWRVYISPNSNFTHHPSSPAVCKCVTGSRARDIFWYLRSSWICFTGNSLPASALWRVHYNSSFPPFGSMAHAQLCPICFQSQFPPAHFYPRPVTSNLKTGELVPPIFNFLKPDRVEDIGGRDATVFRRRVIKRRVFKLSPHKWKQVKMNLGSKCLIDSRRIILIIKFSRNFGPIFRRGRGMEEMEIDGQIE